MDFTALRTAVEEAELVDARAHNLVATDSSFPFISAFSDASSYSPYSFKTSLKEIAELYGCDKCLDAVEEYRRVAGLEAISSRCFEAARITALLIDDGLRLDKMHDIDWHRSFVPVVGRILRIESLAEQILSEELPGGSSWTLDVFTEAFVGKLKSFADNIFGLKSIAAICSHREISTHVTRKDVEEGLSEVIQAGKPVRISNKSFIDYIFTRSLEVALLFDLPMQIHAGFSDKDLNLWPSNPLHLRAVLEEKRFSKSRIVLLDVSSLFSQQASHLASVYPQVYLDFGLAVPKLSVDGMVSSLKRLLELAPIKKVMFSTDGYAVPETFYLGAKKARDVVFSVLRDACVNGDLSIPEAIETAKDIFSQNAVQFYKIDRAVKSSGSANSVSSDFVKVKSNDSENHVSLVRVFWVDASGQQRCREQNHPSDVGESNDGVGHDTTIRALLVESDKHAPEVDKMTIIETQGLDSSLPAKGLTSEWATRMNNFMIRFASKEESALSMADVAPALNGDTADFAGMKIPLELAGPLARFVERYSGGDIFNLIDRDYTSRKKCELVKELGMMLYSMEVCQIKDGEVFLIWRDACRDFMGASLNVGFLLDSLKQGAQHFFGYMIRPEGSEDQCVKIRGLQEMVSQTKKELARLEGELRKAQDDLNFSLRDVPMPAMECVLESSWKDDSRFFHYLC